VAKKPVGAVVQRDKPGQPVAPAIDNPEHSPSPLVGAGDPTLRPKHGDCPFSS
jgi:hypothetical protein